MSVFAQVDVELRRHLHHLKGARLHVLLAIALHSDHKTTLGCIFTLDAGRCRSPATYSFDLGKLARVPVQARL